MARCSRGPVSLLPLDAPAQGSLSPPSVSRLPSALRALGQAAACGCRILATVHGEDRRDVEYRFGLGAEFWERLFDIFLILGKEEGRCVVKRAEQTVAGKPTGD